MNIQLEKTPVRSFRKKGAMLAALVPQPLCNRYIDLVRIETVYHSVENIVASSMVAATSTLERKLGRFPTRERKHGDSASASVAKADGYGSSSQSTLRRI